jgi:outer membrane protein assembly factor BamE (lipoprotein component of BamABCDE complex)
MRPAPAVISLLIAMITAGCLSATFGREFPSPNAGGITVGKTDKTELRRVFGEPYQVGIDSGDGTWRWFYGQRNWGTEKTKDLSVRFNGDGRVKTYSFTSNFPEDMGRLK